MNFLSFLGNKKRNGSREEFWKFESGFDQIGKNLTEEFFKLIVGKVDFEEIFKRNPFSGGLIICSKNQNVKNRKTSLHSTV